ncbi:hypothetical protein GCM10010215_25930 [Streptomyces virginiae]|uniref:Uncharacterized protein n=1 Tax=Streptomyces virginiae TaxID=1961 RepID=A0ABQ3NN79_STRVG|nr:hypothetical protein GCM10010215_25930 [Streptomyces virginiae]GHI14228.1 hypothetical protein Scinn_36910 [Streptomyces virginiae]
MNPAMISAGTIRPKEAFHVQSTEWIRHQEPEANGSITIWCRASSGPARAIRGSPGAEVRVHPAASRAWVTWRGSPGPARWRGAVSKGIFVWWSLAYEARWAGLTATGPSQRGSYGRARCAGGQG